MAYEDYAKNGAGEKRDERDEREEKEVFEAPSERRGYKRGYAVRRKESEFYAPGDIDRELFDMAKNRVFERFAIKMHAAAYGVSMVGATILADSVFWGLRSLLLFGGVVWGIALFLHIVWFFAKGSPEKIMKEYERLNRKMR